MTTNILTEQEVLEKLSNIKTLGDVDFSLLFYITNYAEGIVIFISIISIFLIGGMIYLDSIAIRHYLKKGMKETLKELKSEKQYVFFFIFLQIAFIASTIFNVEKELRELREMKNQITFHRSIKTSNVAFVDESINFKKQLDVQNELYKYALFTLAKTPAQQSAISHCLKEKNKSSVKMLTDCINTHSNQPMMKISLKNNEKFYSVYPEYQLPIR